MPAATDLTLKYLTVGFRIAEGDVSVCERIDKSERGWSCKINYSSSLKKRSTRALPGLKPTIVQRLIPQQLNSPNLFLTRTLTVSQLLTQTRVLLYTHCFNPKNTGLEVKLSLRKYRIATTMLDALSQYSLINGSISY